MPIGTTSPEAVQAEDRPTASSANRHWDAGWWKAARRCPSDNEGPRPQGTAVCLVVLHSISLPPGQFSGDAIERFFTNRLDWRAHPYYDGIRDLRVSAHFVIRRKGQLIQFVSVDRRAWHAGRSSWQGRENCNDFSVGIELEGLEGLHFTAAQYRRLAPLLRALASRYPIEAIAGHEHVAPGRKHDPGSGFDWGRLRTLVPGLELSWADR